MKRRDPDKRRVSNQAYYAKHREHLKAAARAYRLAHPEQYARYNEEGKARRKLRGRAKEYAAMRVAYYANVLVSRERKRQEMARSRAQHPEKHRAQGRAAYAKDIERYREKSRRSSAEWRARHPDKAAAKYAARRAKKRGGFVSATEWQNVLAAWDGRCAYCGARANSVDHVIPLSRGGLHALSNVAPACKRCNCAKGASLPLNFIWRCTA